MLLINFIYSIRDLVPLFHIFIPQLHMFKRQLHVPTHGYVNVEFEKGSSQLAAAAQPHERWILLAPHGWGGVCLSTFLSWTMFTNFANEYNNPKNTKVTKYTKYWKITKIQHIKITNFTKYTKYKKYTNYKKWIMELIHNTK